MSNTEHVIVGGVRASMVFLVLVCACDEQNSMAMQDRIENGNIGVDTQAEAQPRSVLELGTRLNDLHRRATASIGALDSIQEEVFAKIADVEVDQQGNIWVLDSKLAELRVFDVHGDFKQLVARKGQGPTELTSPRAMAIDQLGTLYLSDGLRVHLFGYDGAEFAHRGSFRVNVGIQDMCFLNDVLYVQGLSWTEQSGFGMSVLHRYAKTGEHLSSFGEFVRDPRMMAIMSMGLVACVPDEDLVLYAPVNAAEVHAFTPDGKVSWVSELAGFRTLDLDVNEGGGVRSQIPDGGAHFIHSLEYGFSGAVILQIGLRTRQSMRARDMYASLSTYLLDSSSGTRWFAGDSIPPTKYLDATHLIGVRHAPFPTVSLLSFTN